MVLVGFEGQIGLEVDNPLSWIEKTKICFFAAHISFQAGGHQQNKIWNSFLIWNTYSHLTFCPPNGKNYQIQDSQIPKTSEYHQLTYMMRFEYLTIVQMSVLKPYKNHTSCWSEMLSPFEYLMRPELRSPLYIFSHNIYYNFKVGAWKLNMFGTGMVDGISFSNGVLFLNGKTRRQLA